MCQKRIKVGITLIPMMLIVYPMEAKVTGVILRLMEVVLFMVEMVNEYGKRVCGPHFTNGIRIINDTVIGRTFFWLSILYKNIEKQPFILYPQAASAATKLVEQFAEIIDIIDVD